jgi:hypothetical protein
VLTGSAAVASVYEEVGAAAALVVVDALGAAGLGAAGAGTGGTGAVYGVLVTTFGLVPNAAPVAIDPALVVIPGELKYPTNPLLRVFAPAGIHHDEKSATITALARIRLSRSFRYR